MGKGARGITKKIEVGEGTIMKGRANGAGLPLVIRGAETQRPALAGIPALCGTKIVEAALSILCNVSCHQN